MKMAGKVQGKVAIVTGATTGFGEAIAKLFAKEGAKVVVADITDGSSVVSAISSEGGCAQYFKLDISKRDSWKQAAEFTTKAFGRIDILINNAGAASGKGDVDQVSEDEVDKLIAVNCKGLYNSSAVVVPHMIERKSGVIVNTSSVSGIRARASNVWYGATKGFVERATQGLAAELGPKGIRVNAVAPVRGKTSMLTKIYGITDMEEADRRFGADIPLKRIADPMDIANAVLFLASDSASYINGASLPVDGGRLTV